EPHAHLLEQANRRREMLGRPPISCSPVELAEAEAATSDKRAHAKLQGQSGGGGVVGFGRRHVRAVAVRRYLAQKAVGPSLVTASLALAGEHYGTGAKVPCLLRSTCEEVRLAELQHAHRAQISDSRRCISGQGLLQPGDALLDASRPRVDVPQSRQRDRS